MVGSTRPASVSLGNHPFGMNRAVIRPHAMKAPMLGMIMPARWLPNRWTLARQLLPCRCFMWEMSVVVIESAPSRATKGRV
jgi:hypothetical protein